MILKVKYFFNNLVMLPNCFIIIAILNLLQESNYVSKLVQFYIKRIFTSAFCLSTMYMNKNHFILIS